MKKIKYIILSCAIATIISSCTKLESIEYSTIDPGFFPKTEADASALVTTCYLPFRSHWYGGIYSCAQGGIQVMGEMTTDVADCQWGADPWQPAVRHNWTADNWPVVGNFYQYYRDISKFTIAISRVSGVTFKDEAYKNRLIAEIRCAKGFMGYLLYDWFGPVPLATMEQLKDPLGDVQIPRLSDAEMVKFIETELIEAAKVLPYKYDSGDYGRFTKGTANMLLLKLYMKESRWQDAVNIATELQKAEYGYGLMDRYADIFTLENEGNKEIIHASTANISNPTLWLAHVLPGGFPTTNPNIQKWNGYRMLWNFYDTYEKGDTRLETISAEYKSTSDGVVYNRENPGPNFKKGAIPVKVGEDPASTGEASGVDWVVFRYADVLLTKAEALVRLNKSVSQESIDLLNQIRTRVKLAPYNTAEVGTPEQFLEKMLIERGHELYFEGSRRTDLIRYGKYIEYARKKAEYLGYPSSTQEWFTRMPIPQSAINEGKGKVTQNIGYN
ncbi:MAG: RagB/SusD family nutrient uptake outer membrane protein [Rikenellaceae bacterium]